MPIISVVGRKQRKIRLLITVLYVILTLGAATMVYPFLLMVSTSFASPVDQNEFRVIPRYLYSNESLYRKYVEAKYNEDIARYNAWFGTDCGTFEDIRPLRRVNPRFVEEWRAFKAALPRDRMMLAGSYSPSASKITPESVCRYREFVCTKFEGDLERLNRVYKEANESWMELGMPVEEWGQRSYKTADTPKFRGYFEFKRSLPLRYMLPVSVDGLFQDYLRLTLGSMAAINGALGTRCKDRAEIHLTPRNPDGPAADEWERFVRLECPVHFARMDSAASDAYRKFIRRKYFSLSVYNRAYGSHIASFGEISLSQEAPKSGIALVDWIEFLEAAVPIGMVELISPDVLFRAHLAKKYRTVERINSALGTHFASFQDVSPPYFESDWLELLESRREIRREFIVRNYREIVQYIALHGRSLLNTAILCFGIVLATLTINPLCAYALSRFNLRSTYKILLFLLATMAFPAEVSAIPSFLLVKKFHLLGTYWAIILPGVANGYSIFLLKGFFDSLPKELYEAAIMDGATEMQMYWKITIQLSKPVLAVIGLGAFTMAYGSFMWAFLVCQNPKMWTLMVWLFQMQIWAPQFLVYAGLVLAAIPTLLVFIFCQNIIMRGIIIPSEK